MVQATQRYELLALLVPRVRWERQNSREPNQVHVVWWLGRGTSNDEGPGRLATM